MGTKKSNKLAIRTQIIQASHVYQNKLAGKVFLYVIGDTFFEVVFQTKCFLHLTGVGSTLSAQDFYEKAKKSILTTDQIYFDQRHPYYSAKKKLPCLLLLPALTNSLVCVTKDMQTMTLTYKIGVTNLDFTIGLMENSDHAGNKINGWFLPRTLRVKDKSIEKSKSAEFVDFILAKDASMDQYDTITFSEPGKKLPSTIKELLSLKLSLTQPEAL